MAAADQVLSFHEVGHRRYELSCLRTRNVRDQILRGQLLVDRLFIRGDIGGGKELLVIGGGAAGASCALRAAMLGVNVVLLEVNLNPFTTQLGVSTRWLDPTEFDWPQDHWHRGTMAWGSTRYALGYSASDADMLAWGWTSLFTAARYGLLKLRGRLDYHWGVDARRLRYPKARRIGGGIGAAPWAGYPKGVRPFGAAISCIGFSGEKTSVPSTVGGALVGPKFWSADNIGLPLLGITLPAGGVVRALVSGSGDGAQQDFLRVLTGMFGAKLANAMGLPSKASSLPLLGALLAEDFALRALSWNEPGKQPAQALRNWHQAYEDCAEVIWHDWQMQPGQVASLQKLLRPDIEATWLVGSDVTTYSYGLNRLLAMLVARLHADHMTRPWKGVDQMHAPPLRQVVLYGYRLKSVTPVAPVSHVCGTGCYGHEHEAEVEGTVTGSSPLGPFDVIVARHGIHQRALFASPRVHEQRVPFDEPR